MPKFRILSDLHIDYWNGMQPELLAKEVPADVLVLAGDVAEIDSLSHGYKGAKLRDQLKALCSKYEVIWVMGNHEYWNNTPENAERDFNKIKEALGCKFFEHPDILVDTMWYPRVPEGHPRYPTNFPDFGMVNKFNPWVFEKYAAFERKLHSKAWKVVITHHGCARESIAPEFKQADSNHFFISDQSDYILKYSPRIWVHGHVHNAFDYMLGSTRVVCNPYGYRHEKGRNGFVLDKVIEVDL